MRAKGNRRAGVSPQAEMRGRLVSLPVAFLFVFLACGSRLPPEANAPLPRPKPPPMPGDSIAASQMCSCKACVEGGCCFDARDPSSGSCGSNTSYDFTANAGCGLDVQTCTSRCYERVWRVPNEAACADKQPADCCS